MSMTEKAISIIVKGIDKKLKKNQENAFCPPDGIESHLDIPYRNRDGKTLLMDLYKPVTRPGQELPVIVAVHGGALIYGDKSLARGLCQLLAARGYLVCALEYHLFPAVSIYQQIADVCAGMDFVGEYLLNYDVDYTRLYLLGVSAGAYLATYSAAMHYSRVLQDAVGYKASRMHFKAMAMIGGMFYTRRKDMIGLACRAFYGKDERSRRIAPYTNPEHPQVIYNLAPCYLVTSKADFLQKYSYEFCRALEENGIDHELLDMGDDKRLGHAFPTLHPEYPESSVVADKIAAWFKRYEPNA